MSCLLKINGDNLDIDTLLKSFKMEADHIWRKGEPKRVKYPHGPKNKWSGARFTVSNADFHEFDKQIEDATIFLKKYSTEISHAVNCTEATDVTLDFAIEFRDVAIHGDFLPSNFLKVVGESGVEVLLPHYPCPEDEETVLLSCKSLE